MDEASQSHLQENARAAVAAAEGSYSSGDLETTIDAWERAYDESVVARDDHGAAYTAVHMALHLLIDTGWLATVRGWARRAERHLEGTRDSPVEAWLAVVNTYERLLSGDYAASRMCAARAIALGSARDVPAAVALGRIAEARSVIFLGEFRAGLDLLDAAAVGAFAGGLDPLSLGIAYCEIVCAYQGLGLLDRADEWTGAMERWRRSQRIGSLGGRCRVHRAEILRLRGAVVDAEREALRACEELRPYLRLEFGWPLTELGRVRFAAGDHEGAEEAFTEAHAIGWDAEPGLALVLLAKGDVEAAVSAIRHALGHPSNVPSKELPPNTELRRAPILDAAVEIEIAAGNVDRARAASEALSLVAATYSSAALDACASVARGRVALASGDAASATAEFERGVRLWSEIGAPREAGSARLGLSEALRANGEQQRADLEVRAANAVLDRIRLRDFPEAADRSVREDDTATQSFTREGDYWSVRFAGHSTLVRDLVGMRYLAELLGSPGREMHVLDLVVTTNHVRRTELGDAGAMLDHQAKELYRRRLVEIEEDMEEARASGDLGRAERAEIEREFLVRELSRAVGLSGRDRRASAASERARVSVTRAVRHAIARIHESNAAFGRHLDATIKTGTYCVYRPDPRSEIVWKL